MSNRRAPSYRDVAPVRPLVTADEAGEAMAYVDTIPHELGRTQAWADYLEYKLGMIESEGARLSSETSDQKRKWDAKASAGYAETALALFHARQEAITTKAKRDAMMMKLEIWRTCEATKRAREVFDSRNEQAAASNPRGGFPPRRPAEDDRD